MNSCGLRRRCTTVHAERMPYQRVLQAGRRRSHASPVRRVHIPALTLARRAQVAERFQRLSFTLEMPFKDPQDCSNMP